MEICTFFHWVTFFPMILNHCCHKSINVSTILDVTNYKSFDVLVKQIDEIVQDEGLNVLLNNAGISPKSTRLNLTKDDDLMTTFETNAVAPVMLTKVL